MHTVIFTLGGQKSHFHLESRLKAERLAEVCAQFLAALEQFEFNEHRNNVELSRTVYPTTKENDFGRTTIG